MIIIFHTFVYCRIPLNTLFHNNRLCSFLLRELYNILWNLDLRKGMMRRRAILIYRYRFFILFMTRVWDKIRFWKWYISVLMIICFNIARLYTFCRCRLLNLLCFILFRLILFKFILLFTFLFRFTISLIFSLSIRQNYVNILFFYLRYPFHNIVLDA